MIIAIGIDTAQNGPFVSEFMFGNEITAAHRYGAKGGGHHNLQRNKS